jgi:hypothetical protein
MALFSTIYRVNSPDAADPEQQRTRRIAHGLRAGFSRHSFAGGSARLSSRQSPGSACLASGGWRKRLGIPGLFECNIAPLVYHSPIVRPRKPTTDQHERSGMAEAQKTEATRQEFDDSGRGFRQCAVFAGALLRGGGQALAE